MKIFIISDSTWKSYENEIKSDTEVEITNKPEEAKKILILFRNDDKTMKYALDYSSMYPEADIFIKPMTDIINNKSLIDLGRNIYFLLFNDKDVHLNDFRNALSNKPVSHIDVKFRCNEPEAAIMTDVLFNELFLMYFLLGHDVFSETNLRVTRNSNTIHVTFFNKKHSLTGSIYISRIGDYDERLEIFTKDGNFILTNPISYRKIYFMERYGVSLLYLIKNTNQRWKYFQYYAVMTVSSKIKSVFRRSRNNGN